MKVKVTHLKTNGWPAGTAVGDEVEVESVEGKLPGWAVGKCEVISKDAAKPAEEEKPAGDDKKAKK